MTRYATVGELKAQIDPNGDEVTWTDDDDLNLALALDAATEWIDERTGLSFEEETDTKYYTADDYDLLFIDDLLSLTTLKTDDDADGVYETTWASDDYILEPINGSPKQLIKANPNTGDFNFPKNVVHGVEVVGSWGTTTAAGIPARIKVACLLIAHRLWKRHETLFGIASQQALGVMVIKAKITEDSDVVTLLDTSDYQRPWY